MEWGDAIFGIYLALNGPLEYKSGQEILSKSAQVHISPPGLEFFSKIYYECRSGKPPLNPPSIMSNDSMMDPTKITTDNGNNNNSDKHLIKFLVLSVPYEIKNADPKMAQENVWDNFKCRYADQIIETINQDYTI
ncbi:hypothetical protein BH23THE1_BH23THE1_26890 [soil metagenome]